MQHIELRRQLSQAVSELYREKLITANGGNLSLRLPEQEGFLITPSGMFKGDLNPGSMVALDGRGRQVNIDSSPPSIETSLHLKIYRLKPELGAVIHTHAPAAIIAGLYKLNIPPLTVEMLQFSEIPLIRFYLPGSPELAEAAATALEKHPSAQALLLQNHGLVTMGRNLRAAINSTMALEEAFRIALLCRLLGEEPELISGENCLLAKKILHL